MIKTGDFIWISHGMIISEEIIFGKIHTHKNTKKCKEISCDKSIAFLAEATPSEAANSLVCSWNKIQCRAASIGQRDRQGQEAQI